jgi:hypothetical protein
VWVLGYSGVPLNDSKRGSFKAVMASQSLMMTSNDFDLIWDQESIVDPH